MARATDDATRARPLSYTSLFVLQALARGHRFGFDVMDATGLPSGTVYPVLRRLEELGHLRSGWESDDPRRLGRPRRRYYRLTPSGRRELRAAVERYQTVRRLFEAPGEASS